MSAIIEILGKGYTDIKIHRYIDGTYSMYIDGPTKKEIEVYAASIPELHFKILDII